MKHEERFDAEERIPLRRLVKLSDTMQQAAERTLARSEEIVAQRDTLGAAQTSMLVAVNGQLLALESTLLLCTVAICQRLNTISGDGEVD